VTHPFFKNPFGKIPLLKERDFKLSKIRLTKFLIAQSKSPSIFKGGVGVGSVILSQKESSLRLRGPSSEQKGSTLRLKSLKELNQTL